MLLDSLPSFPFALADFHAYLVAAHAYLVAALHPHLAVLYVYAADVSDYLAELYDRAGLPKLPAVDLYVRVDLVGFVVVIFGLFRIFWSRAQN